jgi:hypothetical protein
MKMEVSVALPKLAIAAIAVVAILVVVLLARIGGEAHYGNCLEKVALEYPPTSRAEPARDAEREDAIDDCSYTDL